MAQLPSSSELQRFLAAQPLRPMQRLAELLGWNGLRLEHGRIPDDERTKEEIRGQVFVYFTTTDWKFHLQVIAYPHGQTRRFQATVNAMRYRIIRVDWQTFELPNDEIGLAQLAETLRPFLKRSNFKDRAWRKQFAVNNSNLVLPKRRH